MLYLCSVINKQTMEETMKTIKNFAKKVLMYIILLVGVFIACTIDSLNLLNVVLTICGMIFVWKIFGLSKTFEKTFESDIE